MTYYWFCFKSCNSRLLPSCWGKIEINPRALINVESHTQFKFNILSYLVCIYLISNLMHFLFLPSDWHNLLWRYTHAWLWCNSCLLSSHLFTLVSSCSDLLSPFRCLDKSIKITWGSGPLLRMACTSPMKFHWFLCKMTQRN